MTDLLTLNDLNAANCALRDWFKSQDISPADAVLVTEFFLARMIITNQQGPADIQEKFDLIEETIRSFIVQIQGVN